MLFEILGQAVKAHHDIVLEYFVTSVIFFKPFSSKQGFIFHIIAQKKETGTNSEQQDKPYDLPLSSCFPHIYF